MPIREENPDNAPPIDIEDTVHALLEMMWTHRQKNKPEPTQKDKQRRKKRKQKEFPELVPCLQEEDDGD